MVNYLHIFKIFAINSWYGEGFHVSPGLREDQVPPKNFQTNPLNCYFRKAVKGKYGEEEKQLKCKFGNVLLTWYKSNL